MRNRLPLRNRLPVRNRSPVQTPPPEEAPVVDPPVNRKRRSETRSGAGNKRKKRNSSVPLRSGLTTAQANALERQRQQREAQETKAKDKAVRAARRRKSAESD